MLGEKVDKETKLKATEITSTEITESSITINWSNKYIGFGQLVYDRDGNILDDECMGKEFSEYVLSMIKRNPDKKTLLVSLYDCDTEYSAVTVDDHWVSTTVELSRNLVHIIYDRYHLMNAGMSLKPAEQKKLVRLQNLLDEYAHVFVCEDGKIEQLK